MVLILWIWISVDGFQLPKLLNYLDLQIDLFWMRSGKTMNLSGKTALVTGGAVRVGKAISLMLAQNGANVVINYFSSDTAARETIKEIEVLGVSALAIQADVSKHDDVLAMVRRSNEQFGGIDVLVNSASLFKGAEFPTDDVSTWHQVTRILIDGSFYF